MTELSGDARVLVDAAERIAELRLAAERYVPRDSKALNAMVKRQRAALTRAINSGDPNKVVLECYAAVREWNQPGLGWPDDWGRWQAALDDLFPVFHSPRIEDLAAVGLPGQQCLC